MKTSINKRAFLLSLLVIATGSAWAEWVEIGGTKEVTYFVDKATIRKDGNQRKMWHLVNQEQPDNNGVRSWRSRNEYDCKDERTRNLTLITHAGPMADGKVITNTDEDQKWNSTPPGTANEALLKVACSQ